MQFGVQMTKHCDVQPLLFQQNVAAAKNYLLRYARQQLRNDAWADDVVAETMLAALEKPQNFHGKSSLNTWLVGILKFKIIDCLRAHSREIASSVQSTHEDGYSEEHSYVDRLVASDDDNAYELPSPETTLQSYEFLAQIDHCLAQMPNNMSRVFYLGEWLGYTTDEICNELKITPSNAWVLLHRARGRLRESLRESQLVDYANAA
ncbi:MAG: sigma-70 family RNA polymerase sigma factor [Casimicrobium sp.]